MTATNWTLITWLSSILAYSLLLYFLVNQYKGMQHPRRLFHYTTMLALIDIPIHGTINTPATVLMHCPMKDSWEVRFSVASEARLYDFMVPRQQMNDVAFVNVEALEGPDVHWSSESLNILITHPEGSLRKRTFTIMVALPEDEGSIAVNLPLRKIRHALLIWNEDTPISLENMSEHIDEELAKFLKKE